jgi:hypothetical protein
MHEAGHLERLGTIQQQMHLPQRRTGHLIYQINHDVVLASEVISIVVPADRLS